MHGFEAKNYDSPDSTRECEGKGDELEFCLRREPE